MISIIIPTYNEEKYIGQTLDQFKNLSLEHEIIVSDDKSSDDTCKIAKEYTNNVLVPEKKHRTIAENRNIGAKIASGDYLVFIDSSCLIENIDNFFKRAVADFESDKKLVALTGQLNVYNEFRTVGDKIMYSIFNSMHYVKNNILHTGEASGKFQMIRQEAFIKIGGYNENLVTREDADLFYRLSKIGRTMYDHKLVILHSGRRAHALGWPKLLSIWMINVFWFAIYGKSKQKNWERWWEKDTKNLNSDNLTIN